VGSQQLAHVVLARTAMVQLSVPPATSHVTRDGGSPEPNRPGMVLCRPGMVLCRPGMVLCRPSALLTTSAAALVASAVIATASASYLEFTQRHAVSGQWALVAMGIWTLIATGIWTLVAMGIWALVAMGIWTLIGGECDPRTWSLRSRRRRSEHSKPAAHAHTMHPSTARRVCTGAAESAGAM
jgi:hypothetical protein